MVLDAAASVGIEGDGRLLALNSYENRVYQLGTDAGNLVFKFYRAGRWSDQQIAEEHEFTAEMAAAELPVAAPLADRRRHRCLRYPGLPFLCLSLDARQSTGAGCRPVPDFAGSCHRPDPSDRLRATVRGAAVALSSGQPGLAGAARPCWPAA